MNTNNITAVGTYPSDELKAKFESLLADNTAMPLQARSDLAQAMTICADMYFAPFSERVCAVPPSGWHCTRLTGHDGPCAAAENQRNDNAN